MHLSKRALISLTIAAGVALPAGAQAFADDGPTLQQDAPVQLELVTELDPVAEPVVTEPADAEAEYSEPMVADDPPVMDGYEDMSWDDFDCPACGMG